jgi:hypothetical protein
MKKVSFNDVVYDIPTSIDELTLEQFIDLYTIIRDGDDLDSIRALIRMASATSGIPIGVVETMSYVTLEDLITQMPIQAFALPKPEEIDKRELYPTLAAKQDKKEFCVNIEGEDYFFQPDPAFTKAGVMADIEQLLDGKDFIEYFHFLMAIAFRRKEEKFDLSLLSEKARLFLPIPIATVRTALFAFFLDESICSITSRIYSRSKGKGREIMDRMLAMSWRAHLPPDGDGIV